MRCGLRGFTLLEVLVALGMLALVSSAVAPAFLRYMQHNTRMELKSGAIQASQAVLDRLRLIDPSTLPDDGGDATRTVEVGERDFGVDVSYCTLAEYCPSSNTRHIKVEVTYRGEKIYEVQTIYTKLR